MIRAKVFFRTFEFVRWFQYCSWSSQAGDIWKKNGFPRIRRGNHEKVFCVSFFNCSLARLERRTAEFSSPWTYHMIVKYGEAVWFQGMIDSKEDIKARSFSRWKSNTFTCKAVIFLLTVAWQIKIDFVCRQTGKYILSFKNSNWIDRWVSILFYSLYKFKLRNLTLLSNSPQIIFNCVKL